MDEPFDDIMKAVWQLRVAFIKHGLQAPAAIELGSYEDGMRFRSMPNKDLMRFDATATAKGMSDPEWVGNLMGVEVRMPAQWRSDLKGKRHAA